MTTKTPPIAAAPRRLGARLGRNDLVFGIVIALICAAVLFATLYPLYFVLIASISDPTAVSTGRVAFLPKNISFFGYQ